MPASTVSGTEPPPSTVAGPAGDCL